jgi:Flp pilus assembly pilin Flp
MRAVRSLGREDGQTMTEYAVVLAVITPAILLALSLISDRVQARIETVVGFMS